MARADRGFDRWFLLDLPRRWLAQRGLPRAWAIVSVVLVTLGLLVWAAVALVPLLIEQLSQLLAVLAVSAHGGGAVDRSGLDQLWALDHGLPADFDLSSDLVAQFSRLATQLSLERLLGLAGAFGMGTHDLQVGGACGDRAGAGGLVLLGADPIVEGRPARCTTRIEDLVQTTLERIRRLFRRSGGVGADPQWWSASGVHPP